MSIIFKLYDFTTDAPGTFDAEYRGIHSIQERIGAEYDKQSKELIEGIPRYEAVKYETNIISGEQSQHDSIYFYRSADL